MRAFFKSGAGMLAAGIYLFMVLFCLLYINLIDANSPPLILFLLLIAPWYYLFTFFLFEPLGINFQHEVLGSNNVDLRNIVDHVTEAASILINASILYCLGFLATKAFKYLSSRS
jgi:hypothetical protein